LKSRCAKIKTNLPGRRPGRLAIIENGFPLTHSQKSLFLLNICIRLSDFTNGYFSMNEDFVSWIGIVQFWTVVNVIWLGLVGLKPDLPGRRPGRSAILESGFPLTHSQKTLF
jgi:hypothetical protein